MFNLFRYGLLWIVVFCGVIVAASLDAYSENIYRRMTWPTVTATVVKAQDFGRIAEEMGQTPGKYPNAQGTVRYVVGGETYEWSGRNRDLGVVAMTPGQQIKLYYNPADPHEANTLVLLGLGVGLVLFAGSLAFLTSYVWYFWLRRRTPPQTYAFEVGDLAGPAPPPRPGPVEFRQTPRTGFGQR